MEFETALGLEISLAIVSFAFLVLAAVHFINYRQQHLTHIQRPSGIVGKINGVSTGVVEFADKVNGFVDDLNNTHKKANLVTTIGYALSFLATLISLIILLNTKWS